MTVRIDELEAEARYASERFRLYRAQAYGSRPTSASRLSELELRSRFADSRLHRARARAATAERATQS